MGTILPVPHTQQCGPWILQRRTMPGCSVEIKYIVYHFTEDKLGNHK